MKRNVIANQIILEDGLSAPMLKMSQATQSLTGEFYGLRASAEEPINISSFNVHNEAIQTMTDQVGKLSGSLDNLSKELRGAETEQQHFNRSMADGNVIAGQLGGKVKSLLAAYTGLRGVKAMLELSDSMSSVNSRLNLMNQGLAGTNAELEDIYQAAQNARGSFFDMADAVTKMGIQAGNAFDSADQVIAFTEQVQKLFVISGTEVRSQHAVLLQLQQALGQGVLRGEEFNSVAEQAPLIINTIAEHMDWPIDQIRKIAREGKITSDVVVDALLSVADETDAAFDQVELTFGQAFTMLKNSALRAIQPILDALASLASSPAMQRLLENLGHLINAILPPIVAYLDIILSGLNMIFDILDRIWPEIEGIAVALTTVGLAIGTINAAMKVTKTLAAAIQAMAAKSPVLKAVVVVSAAVGALIGRVKSLTEEWAESEQMSFSWSAAWAGAVAAAKQAVENLEVHLVNAMGEAKQSIADFTAEAIEGLAGWLDNHSETIDGIVVGFEDAAYGFDLLVFTIKAGILSAALWVAEKVQIMVDAFNFVRAWGSHIFDNLWNYVQMGALKMAQGVVTIIQSMLNSVVTGVQRAINNIVDSINTFLSSHPKLSKAVGLLSGVGESGVQMDGVSGPATPIALDPVDFSGAIDAIDSWALDATGSLQGMINDIEVDMGPAPEWGDFAGQTQFGITDSISNALEGMTRPSRGDYNFRKTEDFTADLRGMAQDLLKDPFKPKEAKRSISDAFKEAYRAAWADMFPNGLEDPVTDEIAAKIDDIVEEMPGLNDAAKGGAGSGRNTADNTGKMAKDLEVGSERLKYLRDIAEREVINRFTTAEIKIEQTNNNDISSEMDLDGVTLKLTEGLKEAMQVAVEGAY